MKNERCRRLSFFSDTTTPQNPTEGRVHVASDAFEILYCLACERT